MLTRYLKQVFQIRGFLTRYFSCSAPCPGNEEETEEKVQRHNAGIDEEGKAKIHPKKDRAELPREGSHPIHTAEQRNRPPTIRYRNHIRHIRMPSKHPQCVPDATNQLGTDELEEMRRRAHTNS